MDRDHLESCRRSALDALGVAERLNIEFVRARDNNMSGLAEFIDCSVRAATSIADTAQLKLLEASGIEADYGAPAGSDAGIAALLDQGAASAEQITAFFPDPRGWRSVEDEPGKWYVYQPGGKRYNAGPWPTKAKADDALGYFLWVAGGGSAD